MDGTLVVFHLPPGSPPSAHKAFRRAVYGEDTTSWGGRYRYRRRGLLDGIPHVRLYWGVVIVREEDANRLVAAMRRHGGVAQRRTIKLSVGDQRTLRGST